MESRELAVASLIAALYAILVYVLPMVSFLLWQVRIADSLLPLSTVFGYPAVVGVTIGCFLGNILSAPWGSSVLNAFDAILGSSINFIAGYIAFKLAFKADKRRKLIASILQAIIVSVGVGSYLKYLLLWAFNTNIPILLSIAGVLPGSVVSIVVLGVPLSFAVEKALKRTGYRF
mgnify:CR=1 FL=1